MQHLEMEKEDIIIKKQNNNIITVVLTEDMLGSTPINGLASQEFF